MNTDTIDFGVSTSASIVIILLLVIVNGKAILWSDVSHVRVLTIMMENLPGIIIVLQHIYV